jgi:endonuclease/exonuclease/phosphatase family metal-dependent hydrolase
MKPLLIFIIFWGACTQPNPVAPQEELSAQGEALNVMAWNIWHGGREDGEQVGVQKTIDVIRDSGADLVAMQETYGSGEIISKALGFYFAPRGTNVSIHSRYPVIADVSVFEEFKCVGAVVELPDGSPLVFYSIWLPFQGDIWLPDTRASKTIPEMLAVCQPSADDLEKILSLIDSKLEVLGFHDAPVILAGDFNSMSHLDYTIDAAPQYGGLVIPWPTSRLITDAGFVDSYRQVRPNVRRNRDRTWSPRFREQEKDRIDFIYFRGDLAPTQADVIQSHSDGFPSDHAAVTTSFRLPHAAMVKS